MKKRKISTGDINNIFQILTSVVLLIILAHLIGIIDLNQYLGTSIPTLSIIMGGYGTGGFGDVNINLPDYDNSPTTTTCSDYDIAHEYSVAMASVDPTAYNTLKSNCLAMGGVFTETNSELSCYWDPAVGTIDCNNPGLNNFETFCEVYLKADWHCNNALAYVGCECERALPGIWVGDTQPDPEPDEEPQEEFTYCENVELFGYSDHGTTCREQGYCAGEPTYGCEHYWDFANAKHRCGCSSTFFCVSSNCHEYFYDVDCECDPNSWKEITSRSTFRCVPVGYSCESGTPVKLD